MEQRTRAFGEGKAAEINFAFSSAMQPILGGNADWEKACRQFLTERERIMNGR